MSHPGIDVTFLSSGLIEPKKLQILKDKRDISGNSFECEMRKIRQERKKYL